LELTEVQRKLLPGLAAALDESLDYKEITQLCQLAVVDLAIRRTGSQYRAAMKLCVSQATVSRMVQGKTHQPRHGRAEAQENK
jgi:hypothetical protein